MSDAIMEDITKTRWARNRVGFVVEVWDNETFNCITDSVTTVSKGCPVCSIILKLDTNEFNIVEANTFKEVARGDVHHRWQSSAWLNTGMYEWYGW
jgi:hypothetical protein